MVIADARNEIWEAGQDPKNLLMDHKGNKFYLVWSYSMFVISLLLLKLAIHMESVKQTYLINQNTCLPTQVIEN